MLIQKNYQHVRFIRKKNEDDNQNVDNVNNIHISVDIFDYRSIFTYRV